MHCRVKQRQCITLQKVEDESPENFPLLMAELWGEPGDNYCSFFLKAVHGSNRKYELFGEW